MARTSKNKIYFTADTQKNIVEYNLSQDNEVRNKIFTEHIYLPFYKLAENIIHTFKFYYTDVDDIEDLKHEIVSMLLEEKIMKFDSTNGAKAYSYFGTIVKRWLINYNNKNYRRSKQVGSFEDIEESYKGTLDPYFSNSITLKQFVDKWVELVYTRLEELFPREGEKEVADAILTIFKTRYDIDIFKKKALYIYVREMTDCETPTLTRVISILKVEFYELYYTYYDQGRLVLKEE